MTPLEHIHIPNDCYKERIQELAEQCDHEYHMSALPLMDNKERAMRGRTRVLKAIVEFKQLLEITKCLSCRDEITNQIALQEEGLQEIEKVWNV
jgi:hypothetical protein